MSEKQFWHYRLKNAGNGFMVYEGDEDTRSNLCDVFMTNDPNIAKSRARLIAAAPDLYDACKTALGEYGDGFCDESDHCKTCATVRLLKSAIAKAEGKEGTR